MKTSARSRRPGRLAALLVGSSALFLAPARSGASGLGIVGPVPGFVGVSTVRDAAFHNEPLLLTQPQESDQFATALACGDFDGDGAADVVSGMPFDDGVTGFEVHDGGAFMVSYGASPGGPGGDVRFYSQFSAGSPDPDEEDDHFGFALAVGDFNADGKQDLAVSSPGHDEGPGPGGYPSGAVAVHYGGASGLEENASEWLVPVYTPGLENQANTNSLYCGEDLAAGDFDGDGDDDLAIGCWFTHITREGVTYDWAGGVFVLRGSPQGLIPVDAEFVHQDYGDIAGGAEEGDFFGSALAAGNFNGDAFDDLAVGVPGENGTGAVAVLFGDATFAFDHNEIWFQGQTGGTDEAGDRFGDVLAAADFDRDGYDDLAVGVPAEDLGSGINEAPDAGAISILYGSSAGIQIARSDYFRQSDISELPLVDNPQDQFGAALAAGDFDGDGFADLAVGHPGEAAGGSERGAMTILMGQTGGFGAGMRWSVARGGQSGWAGASQNGARFGRALAAGDLDGDGFSDLVVGSPFQDVDGIADTGRATIYFGSLFADGFESGAASLWSGAEPPL